MKNKRGISAVVATVLIILITVAAVAIVWTAVIPIVKTNLEIGTACINADVLIDAGSGYTCYDAEKKIVAVQVKKGANEVDISKVEFLLGSEGTSRKITKLFDLGSNVGETFYLVVDEDAEDVSVAPVVKVGNKERACDVSSNVKLSRCSLGEKVVGDFLNEQGIVGFWRFEDNTEDLAGENDGTIYGNPVYAEGRNGIGRALNFDGVDDYVGISDPGVDSVFDLIDAVTMTMWIKPKVMPQVANTGLGGKGSNYFMLFHDGQEIRTYFWNGTAHRTIITTSNGIIADNWYHITTVYEPGNFKIYVNGIQKASSTSITDNMAPDGLDVVIGSDRKIANRYFNGTIDEVMIFNKALSEDEVKALYEFDLS